MRTVNTWLDEYAESHRNAKNKVLHWLCVPVIVVSVIGLLWALPVPQAFREISPWLNWGTLVLAAGLVYYFALSPRLGLGMVAVLLAVALCVRWLDGLSIPLWITCVTLFVVAWIGQFIGHVYEGKRPSFFKDVQFLLIGPLWLLAHVYRSAGLRF
jgi:uncharacterized membrane protein YGL010W